MCVGNVSRREDCSTYMLEMFLHLYAEAFAGKMILQNNGATTTCSVASLGEVRGMQTALSDIIGK